MGNSSSKSDKLIALVGPTGSGKSRIIDCLAKTNWASSSLAGGGTKVRSQKIQVEGKTVVLIDTPGFDLDESPLASVDQLDKWLKNNYNKKVRLTGILYVHRISDNRMKSLSPGVLQKLLERTNKVILVTTMWDTMRDPKKPIAEGREAELRTKYWKEMLDWGAHTDRFDNKESTASRILKQLVKDKCE